MWGDSANQSSFPPSYSERMGEIPPSTFFPTIWYWRRHVGGIPPLAFFNPSNTDKNMWRELPPSTFSPSIWFWWRDVGGKPLLTFFPPIWYWQRDVGVNPIIKLPSYLILTERGGGIPPSTFLSPIWNLQRYVWGNPHPTSFQISYTDGEMWGNPPIHLPFHHLILIERCGAKSPYISSSPHLILPKRCGGNPHPPSCPPPDTRVDMWGESSHPPYFPPSDTSIVMWRIPPLTFFSPYNTDRKMREESLNRSYLQLSDTGGILPLGLFSQSDSPRKLSGNGDLPIILLFHIWYWQGCMENTSINYFFIISGGVVRRYNWGDLAFLDFRWWGKKCFGR